MGLLRLATNVIESGKSVLGDQYEEYVTCPEVENDVIIQRGIVHHGDKAVNSSQGIISNGSVIAVPQGMAMMIVDNGEIKEFSAEPGEFKWDSGSEPSVFAGGLKNLWDNLGKSVKVWGKRIAAGEQTMADQRVYYVNIKTIPGQLFGSSQPETIFDPVYGSVEITYNGEYAIKVADPATLVSNIVGANPKDTLTYDDIFKSGSGQNMLKSKFAQKVSEAISNIMTLHNVSFNRIQSYKSDVTDQMNNLLDAEWLEKYGIIVEDVALRVNASEESRKIVQEMDAEVAKTTRMGQVYSNNMAGTMAAASAEAMKTAAGNEAGAMMGFMGMGFGQMQGTNMMGAVANMPNQAPAQPEQPTPPAPGSVFPKVEEPVQPEVAPVEQAVEATAEPAVAEEVPKAKFCSNCGTPVNGKFCSNCGNPIQ